MDEALKFAQQALDLTVKTLGSEHTETAIAHMNLGLILREKKKYKESAVSFRRVAEIYEKLGTQSKKLIETYEALAFTQFLGKLKTEFEANYLKAIETAEAKFGKESKESFSPVLNLANIYAREKKLDKANEFYLKGYEIAYKNFGKDAEELNQIQGSRICMGATTQNGNSDSQKKFSEAIKKILGDLPEPADIINGKALSLPKPRYPSEARNERIGGTIAVGVQIDELGNVTKAKAMCGHPILAKVSEESAFGAKFTPTLIHGKRVKVNGIITYNFAP